MLTCPPPPPPPPKKMRWTMDRRAALPIVLVGFGFFMPESPRWLVEHGETVLAESVLAKTCAPEEADQVMTSLQQDRVLGYKTLSYRH